MAGGPNDLSQHREWYLEDTRSDRGETPAAIVVDFLLIEPNTQQNALLSFIESICENVDRTRHSVEYVVRGNATM